MKGPNRAAVVLALLGSLALAGTAAGEQGSAERPFRPGGQVRMSLSAADYTIQAGREDRILVRWETQSAGDASRVKVTIQPNGSTATIYTKGPRNNLHMVIEVPARCDLRVDLSAGNLRVRGITGNKDLGSWAGNIDVEIGRGEDYATIDTSVKAGDIRARPLNASKSGLFRSFRWKGPGRHVLRVRLTAGNVRLT